MSCAGAFGPASPSSWKPPGALHGGRDDGEGGIRTLEAGYYPPNALAGRRLQPLGHFSRLRDTIANRLASLLRRTAARYSAPKTITARIWAAKNAKQTMM